MTGSPLQPIPETSDEIPFQTGKVLTLGLAHGMHDLYTSFVAPLLPVLIQNLSLTKTLAGSLTIFTQLPSLFQPFIGHIADRMNLRWLVILGPALTGIMVSLIGTSPHYVMIAIFLSLAGFSSAALHSVGPVMVGYLSGNRLGQGMSIWMVSAEIARVIGPILIVAALGYLTFPGIPWLMIGGILVSIVLYFRLRNVSGLAPSQPNNLSLIEATRKMRSLLIPLAGLLVVQGYMAGALTTYLPIFLTDEGANLWFAGASLSVFEIAGAVGALLAGPMSDRIGRRVILLTSQVASPLFMLLFLVAQGWMRFPVLLLLGFASIPVTPVIMAMVQESYPQNRALANGIYMALGFVIRAVMVILIGRIGDLYNLRTAYSISVLLMLLGTPLVFLLPNPQKRTYKRISENEP